MNKRTILLICSLLAAGAVAITWRHRATPQSSPTSPKLISADTSHAEPNSKILTATKGKRAKLVWVENRTENTADQYAISQELTLQGYDTKSGLCTILAGQKNYNRPLLTPDGMNILYTDRGETSGSKETPKATIRKVDWDGKNDMLVAEGCALDIVKDGEGTVWVYALKRLLPGSLIAVRGEELVRFPLANPERLEPIYSKAHIGVDNFQVSRDGSHAVGLFPWPEAAILNLKTSHRHKLRRGCWPSMAPDNSFINWVFDGSHKRIQFYDTIAKESWGVNINRSADLKGHQVYHPRWSNHPLFFTFSGPYILKTTKHMATTTRLGGHGADIYLAHFAPDLKRVENVIPITRNSVGEFYPDLWIEDGDSVDLTNFPQAPPDAQALATTLPHDGTLFSWKLADAENQVPGRSMDCQAMAKGSARYGSRGEMLLDGGQFVLDDESQEVIRAYLQKGQTLAWDCTYTEHRTPSGTGPIRLFSLTDSSTAKLEIIREGRFLCLVNHSTTAPIYLRLPLELTLAKPTHLSFTLSPSEISIHHGGKLLHRGSVSLRLSEFANTAFCIGGHLPDGTDWLATMENLTISSAISSQEELAEKQSHAENIKNPSLPRTKVRCRLTRATAPDANQLGSYRRLLVGHSYEVEKVIEGECSARMIEVLHWAMLDRQPVANLPTTIDQSYELNLEPLDSHPEINSELQQTDSEDLESPVFLDVASPRLQAPSPE